MCSIENRGKEKHSRMLGKPFGDILDYWIRVFAVDDLISDTEKNRMLTWITSKYDATKCSDAYSRIYFVRKVLLANATRKGWINPYADQIENPHNQEISRIRPDYCDFDPVDVCR